MTDYLSLLPVLILTVYNSIRIIDGRIKKYWWKALLFLAGAAGIWEIVHAFCSMTVTDQIVLTALVLFSFELLHVRNHKMSLPYHMLFYLTVAVTSGGAVLFPEAAVISEYSMLLICFLTESNQRYMKKTYEESAALYQNMILTKQVNEVQNIYMTMRGWRHDYHNHLQSLKAYLKLNQTEEARLYLDRLETDLDSINRLIESGNVNLDAILNSKLSLALTDGIEVNYKAQVPAQLTVSDIDLCVLIGNLIDNAVEACDKMEDQSVMENHHHTGRSCEVRTEVLTPCSSGNLSCRSTAAMEFNEKKFIRLYIGVMKKQLYISVTNSTDEIVKKLDDEYITTKRGNHGHGLKRINNIVEKYQGYINRKNEPGVFVTEIMLPL